MFFSLVVATLNRVDELERLLCSLLSSEHRDFEIILVDQNADRRLDELVRRWSQFHLITHVRIENRGANYARNQGFQLSRGEIVCFADDDCWFDPETLGKVEAIFEKKEVDAVFGCIRDQDGKQAVGKFPEASTPITAANTWSTAIESAAFFRRVFFEECGFDESLGPGPRQRYAAHEIDDLVIRAFRQGKKMIFEPSVVVRHNQISKGEWRDRYVRAHKYGLGMGYVMGKHRVAASQFLPVIVKPLLMAVVMRMTGQRERADFYEVVWRSRLLGRQEYGS